jgi:long-chain alkane monooxygenase
VVGLAGFDLAPYELEDALTVVPNDAIRSLSETFGAGAWTLGDVLDRLAVRPGGPVAVGTGAEVVDRIQEWVHATDSDGLNLWHVITPGTYVDFAEYVVPELQRRGVYRTAYEPGTLRDKLFGRGPRLRAGHPAVGFRTPVRAGQSR